MSKKLIEAKKKLIKKLPSLHGIKAIKARKAIKAIDERLAQQQILKQISGTIGGLDFESPSPPGIGRLVTLPFYPVNANADIVTSAGQNAASSQNPSCIALIGNTTNNAVSSFVMRTPQISWAELRIVGFECEYKTLCSQDESSPTLLVSDLKIGGSTNLFTHDSFADAALYSKDVDDYAGPRS